MDADGFFFIVDRLKEFIKYKGFQVAPAELEGVLLTHPAVADCAVIPMADEEAGEVPKAFVVMRARRNFRGAHGVRGRQGGVIQEGALGGVHREDSEVALGQDPAPRADRARALAHRAFVIKYIGSKRTLVPRILAYAKAIRERTGASSFCDMFTGTTRVAQALKRAHFKVTANDLASYSEVLAIAYIEADAERHRGPLTAAKLAHLNALAGRDGYFTQDVLRGLALLPARATDAASTRSARRSSGSAAIASSARSC